MTAVRLACLDMAGTTVADDGLVVEAFEVATAGTPVAADRHRLARARRYVLATMGRSKLEVFRALLEDDAAAARATAAFEAAYAAVVDRGDVAEVPGAAAAIGELRAAGVQVALTTGFGAGTRDAILAALGWQDAVDLALCPADAGRGRPWPDMILTAMAKLGVTDPAAVAVAGDTTSDIVAGRRAGAAVVVGVLTGAHDAVALRGAGATDVLESVAELPALLR